MASRVFGVGRSSDCSGGFMGDGIGMGGWSGTPGGFCCPGGVEEGETDMKPWELLF